MCSEDEILLHLKEALGVDHGQRVLLCLNGALLQGGEYLGQSHRGGLCAQCFKGGHGHGSGRGADDQIVAVGHAGDLAVGGDVARAAGVVGKALHACGFHQVLQLLPDLAVEHLIHVLIALDEVRHTDHAQIRLVGLHGLAGKGDITAALREDGLDDVHLGAQLAVGEDLDLDLAV